MIWSNAPVTAAASRRVKPGMEDRFEAWADGITSAASSFPGHLGAGVIRPAESGGEYTIIYRFDTQEHFDAWQGSKVRADWIESSRVFIDGEPRVEKATGLEYWFHDPGCSYTSPPPVYKQALLTWLGLYPTVLFVSYTVGVPIGSWHVAARSVFTSGTSVLIMTWLVMPIVTRVFRRFLRPEKPREQAIGRL